MKRLFLLLALSAGGLMTGGRVAAQTDASNSFCILPLYDAALTSGVPDAQLQAEMTKLQTQIGPSRKYFKIGFSNIFGGPTAGASECRMATANNLFIGFVIALQTHDVTAATAAVAAQDFRLYQWRLDGVTWQGVYSTDGGGNEIYPSRDYQVVTPSRYATAVQNSYRSQFKTQADQIVALMRQYPGTVVVVNAAIEEELATGDGTDAYLADYSPFAVTEFRDWLRHTGMYDDSAGTFAGQGAPAAITGAFVKNSQGVLSSPFHDDPGPGTLASGRTGSTFNATFGTNFTTWTLLSWDLAAFPNPITDANFKPTPPAGATGNTPGGFDAPRVRNPANAFWNAWSYDLLDHNGTYPAGNPTAPAFGFRQVMVKNFVNDMLGVLVTEGIPKQIVYAHQIPGETAGATRARTGADPMWTGLTDFNGHLGVTRFGPFPYDTALTYSQNWGIFEWHPDPGASPTDPALYGSTVSSLNSYYANGAHVLFPGWWENSNGATFPLTDSNFALGLHDWLAAQPDLPPPGGQGLAAQFFNNTTLSGTAVLTRVDPAVNFSWNGAPPAAGLGGTNFSVRWTGWVQARYTDTYTFYVTSDDGSRLSVNGTQLLSAWYDHPAQEASGTISLVAGQYYPIVLEYYQGGGGDSVSLSWSSANQSKQIISQNQLYPALPPTNWTNTAVGGTLDWGTAGNWSGGVAPTGGTNAALQFLGGQTAAAGTLTANESAPSFSLNALQLGGTAAGSGASAVTLGGGVLQLTDTDGGTRPIITLDAVNSASYPLVYTVNNALTLGDYTTVLGNGTAGFTFAGVINGPGGLSKQGSAALTLAGSNHFAGAPVTVSGGMLTLANDGALAGASAVYVQAGGQLATSNAAGAQGTFANVPMFLNGNGPGANNGGGALRFNQDGSNVAWPGGITLGSGAQITFFSAGGTYAFPSPITGRGDLQWRGGGAANSHYHTVVLSAASTYAGNTTATGDAANLTLQLLGGADRLPTGTVLTLAGDNFYGPLRGWLDLNGNDQALAGLSTANGAHGAGDNRVVNGAASTQPTLNVNNPVNCLFTGTLGGASGDNRSRFNLTKNGVGILTLNGVNTYTGNTLIQGGTLALVGPGNTVPASPRIDLAPGTTLDVSGITGGCVLGAGQILSGTGSIVGALTIAGSHQPYIGATQTFRNGLTFAATAHELWQLFGNTTTGAGLSYDQVAVAGTVTITNGAVIDVNLASSGSQVVMSDPFWTQTHSWTVLTAAAVSGPFAVGVAGSDPAGHAAGNYGTFSVAQTSTTVSLVWTPFAPFKVWQNTTFGASAGNPAVAGPLANPAGDGIANLTKYALGLDPNASAVTGLPTISAQGGFLKMRFSRNPAATDLSYRVQASNDLAVWATIATRVSGASSWTSQGSTVTDGNGQVVVTDGTAESAVGRRFLRLSISMP